MPLCLLETEPQKTLSTALPPTPPQTCLKLAAKPLLPGGFSPGYVP